MCNRPMGGSKKGCANRSRQIERLWKWMKERVIYNTYYEYFEDFKEAVIGFFAALPTIGVESVLGRSLRSRVRDKFRPMGASCS